MIYKNYASIENSVQNFLNSADSQALFQGSPRTVGDRVEDAVMNNIGTLISKISHFDKKFARRSMEDLAFEDADGNYYAVDVKTHNVGTDFNMPNLISVRRVAKFLEEPTNNFCLLKIDYSQTDIEKPVQKVHFVPIEHLDWSCLTLGALGWGQIQIADARTVTIDRSQTRKSWMLRLCDRLELFYPAEISKINTRIGHFSEVRRFWDNQPA